DAVVVLGSAILHLLPVKAPLVMMLPAEGLVLAANAHDEGAMARMLDEAEAAYAASGEFRSLRTVVYEAGAEAPVPKEWFTPEDHPLSDRYDRAATRSVLTELEGEHQIFAADKAPMAHQAIVDDDGGSVRAAWARDSDVVVTWLTNDLVLLDTPEQPLPNLTVPFDLFRETFPAAIEPLVFDDETEPEDAKLFRLRGALFPTAHERKFLLQRDAFLNQSPDAEAREVGGAELLADFDGGATLLVTAGAGERAGLVQLTSPDGRTAHVAPSAFGARAEKLPPVDRHRYYQSFFVQKMLRLMLGGEVDESEIPAMPEGLEAQASASRPTVLSSNELRRMRSEYEKQGDDLAAQLTLTQIDTWEPAHLFPVVRPPGYEQGAAENERGMVRGLAGGDVQVINPTKPLSRPAPEGLRLDLVSDRGNRMMLINGASMHEDLQQTMWRTALLNLEAASLKPLKQEAEGRYAGDWHDDYDFSRLLLLPKLVSACKVKGAPLVFAPTVGRTWVTGSEDVAGQAAVLDAIDAH
ncbi:MAG TPA: hypothetical protein VGE37_06730, partial [Archangium sp.]